MHEILDAITAIDRPVSLILSQWGEFFICPELMEETTRLCNARNNLVGVTLHTNLRADLEGVIGPFIDGLKSEQLVVNGSLDDSSIPHAEVDRFFEEVKKLRSRGVTVLKNKGQPR